LAPGLSGCDCNEEMQGGMIRPETRIDELEKKILVKLHQTNIIKYNVILKMSPDITWVSILL